jgi:signal transduction histidine kinase
VTRLDAQVVARLTARVAAPWREMAGRVATLPQSLVARVAALPPLRRQRVQDLALGLVLAAANMVSLLPYRGQLHPFWLALVLVAAQGVLLIWRRSFPVAVSLFIGAARVSYDQIGFGFAPFPLGPAIALYTVIDRSCPVWGWMVSAGTATGIAVSLAAPGRSEPYEAIFQALIFGTAAVAGMLSRAKRANLLAAEGRADLAEAELDRRVSQQAAAERTRIARELHDVVAHHVSLMAVQAEAAMSLLPERPAADAVGGDARSTEGRSAEGRPADARRSVEIIADTARLALTELRRLLGVLRGPSEQLETAPSASLSELAVVLDQVRDTGLSVDFGVEGTRFPLPPGVDLTAYRIIQEALTNTIRHSRADSAAVTLCYEPGYVTVRIADSGRRRDRPPVSGNGSRNGGAVPELGSAAAGSAPAGSMLAGSGLGLAGIAERVASCGGNLTVGPTPGGGFSVTARLPSR